MYVFTNVHMHICIDLYIYIQACMQICVCVCKYICVYTRANIIHQSIYIYICQYMSE